MNITKRTLSFVTLGLIVWAAVATLTSAYYYNQYVETRRTFEELKSLVIDVNVLMDYGNENPSWHNETVIAGATAFDALLAITTNVEYQTAAYGVFVTSIDGVKNVAETQFSGRAWFWYYWNATSSSWTDLMKASDAYILRPNDSIEWLYQSYSL